MNNIQWNFKRKSYIFIQEKAFETVICEMLAVSSRPQYVNFGKSPCINTVKVLISQLSKVFNLIFFQEIMFL